jgi:hypothetical protein
MGEDQMADRQQWEYEVIDAEPGDDLSAFQTTLNDLGANGWEMVGLIQVNATNFAIFKRPKGWG